MPIYIEKGFKKARPNELLIKTSPFEWLQEYEPKTIQKKKNEDDASFLGRLQKEVKEKQEYFISGRIEPCNDEGNKWHRISDDITWRDLIVIDYDDIDTDTATFIEQVKNALPNTALLFYPSLRYTVEKPRMRVVIEPSRALVGYEYEIIGIEIAKNIGLPYDPSFTTWTQVQGLPVITPLNKEQPLLVIDGEKYSIPEIIEPPIKKNHAPIINGLNDNREFIPRDKAIEIFIEYVDKDGENLHEYINSFNAIIVLAKAVQIGEIDIETALACSEILAMGNEKWIEGNIVKLKKELLNKNIKTPYTFKRKFYDLFHKEEIKTMNDVEMRLALRGKELRAINSETKRNGEVKESKIAPILIANTLLTALVFVMIGDGISKDKSVLHYWNYDTKLYVSSEIDIHNLILRVEPKSVRKDWADTIAILKALAEKVTPEESRYLIPVQNGIYNKQTKKLEAFDPKYIITSKIETPYKPNAEKPKDFDVDEWFSSLACGDEEVATLLWQMINEATNSNYTRGKVGILYGPSGNNGKSTYLALAMNVIGRENVSTLKPPEFGEKFKVSQINGKVANFGEEISDAYIDDIHNLMCIATGDPITVEEKGKPPFTLISKAFCVFSGNSLPRTRNKDGWGRRALIIPFYADFSGQVNDPRIKDEYIKRQDVKEYVLKKAIEMDFDKFIIPKVVQEEIENYQLENDNVRAYIQEEYIENNYHLRKHVPIDIIKEDYLNWLESKKLKRDLPYRFGKTFVEKLKKMTSIRYELKKVRVSIEQLEGLPPIARKHKSTNARNAIVNLDV